MRALEGILDEALEAKARADAQVQKAAKAALKEVLHDAFQNPRIATVAWGQKYSEYNDEGMYPGIAGPVINVVDPEDPRADAWGWLGGWGTSTDDDFPTEQRRIKTVLDKVGPEVLCEIVGDDEYMVYAVRSENPDGFIIDYEHMGY